MKCNTCGRSSQNEEANFCEYCGSSFREHMHSAYNMAPREQSYKEASDNFQDVMSMQLSGTVMGQKVSTADKIEKPISFINWLGTYALLFIPVIGGLIFFIMLFVWAFSGTVPESKKNWARVTLISIAVGLIILFAYLVTIISSPMFQQMLNGTFDYNSYYQSLQNVK